MIRRADSQTGRPDRSRDPRGTRSRWTRYLLGLVSLAVATGIWLPCLHWFFLEDVSVYFDGTSVPARTQKLANRHLRLWVDDTLRQRELARMRASNAEWDFMGRTFLVLAFAVLTPIFLIAAAMASVLGRWTHRVHALDASR